MINAANSVLNPHLATLNIRTKKERNSTIRLIVIPKGCYLDRNDCFFFFFFIVSDATVPCLWL